MTAGLLLWRSSIAHFTLYVGIFFPYANACERLPHRTRRGPLKSSGSSSQSQSSTSVASRIVTGPPPQHSLHLLRCRPCSQRPLPPQSLHPLRRRPCLQIAFPIFLAFVQKVRPLLPIDVDAKISHFRQNLASWRGSKLSRALLEEEAKFG